MRINALLLADEADVRDDRLYVSGGGWDALGTTAWPAGHPFSVVALLAPGKGDVGRDLTAVLTVLAPDGSEAGRTEATVRVERLRAQVPVVFPLAAAMEGPGGYRVSLTVGAAKAQVGYVLDGPPPDVRVEDAEG